MPLKYVQKGIDFSIRENNISYLPALLELKGYILVELEQKDDAKECWQQAIAFLKLKINAIKTDTNLKYSQLKYEELTKQLALLEEEKV